MSVGLISVAAFGGISLQSGSLCSLNESSILLPLLIVIARIWQVVIARVWQLLRWRFLRSICEPACGN